MSAAPPLLWLDTDIALGAPRGDVARLGIPVGQLSPGPAPASLGRLLGALPGPFLWLSSLDPSAAGAGFRRLFP